MHRARASTVGGVTCAAGARSGGRESLVGSPGSAEAIAARPRRCRRRSATRIGDSYASGEYRMHLAAVLARRALSKAFEAA